ncbi:MAG: hypothetical protein E7660_07240 [Ruminococcaceae bacterium]|nr:hypothetical protein [Oscillospiraceae bacterium]
MTLEIYKLCAAALICLAVILILKNIYPTYSTVVSAICITAVLALSVTGILHILNFTKELETAGRLYEGFDIILKGCAVCFITEASADICERCEEPHLAKALSVAGRVELAVLGLPLFRGLIDCALKFSS